jgi:hypothetical protein
MNISAANSVVLTKGRRALDPGSLPAACEFEPYDELREEYVSAFSDFKSARAATGFVVQEIAQAREEHPKSVYRARTEGTREPKDPIPALEAKSRKVEDELEVSALRVLELSDKVAELQSDPELHEHARELVRKRLAGIEEAASKIADELVLLDEDIALRGWSSDGRGKRGTNRAHAPTEALLRELEALKPKRPTVYVSPVEYARLRNGEDATDRDGNPVSQEDAQELRRLGLLKVHHGRLRAVGRPS